MKNKITFRLKIYLTVFTTLLSAGITGFMFIEKMSFIDAVYFSIITMATVGYGDIHPQTEIGKILAMIIVIGGVGTFLGIIAGITDMFVNRREEAIRHKKTDMVISLFFSEMGNRLLKHFTRFDPAIKFYYKILKVSAKWKNEDFENAYNFFKNQPILIDYYKGDILALFNCLQKNSDLLLRLIENPAIQEYENFTELLRALFHLRDELLNRDDLTGLLDSDRRHLEGDIARAYSLLIFEWLHYIRYLKKNYGYLFSLAVRINPFNPDARAIVKK